MLEQIDAAVEGWDSADNGPISTTWGSYRLCSVPDNWLIHINDRLQHTARHLEEEHQKGTPFLDGQTFHRCCLRIFDADIVPAGLSTRHRHLESTMRSLPAACEQAQDFHISF